MTDVLEIGKPFGISSFFEVFQLGQGSIKDNLWGLELASWDAIACVFGHVDIGQIKDLIGALWVRDGLVENVMSRRNILMLNQETSILTSDKSHSQAVILLQASLEGIKVQFSGLFIITLPFLKINSVNCSLNEPRSYLFVQLLK